MLAEFEVRVVLHPTGHDPRVTHNDQAKLAAPAEEIWQLRLYIAAVNTCARWRTCGCVCDQCLPGRYLIEVNSV